MRAMAQYQYFAIEVAADCPDRFGALVFRDGATPETRRMMFTRLDMRHEDYRGERGF